jgi:hypothetical protein
MNTRSILSMAAIAALGLTLVPNIATAQQRSLKDQIVGTWTLVSWVQTLKDGSKNLRFGNDPKGVNTFTPDGQFTLIITRSNLPKISSGNPEKPTAEEAQAIVSGSIAYFGTYTVDEATKTVSEHIDATTLLNQLAIPQTRVVTSISADSMTYSNSNPVGGGNIELVWKRAK